jgi:hypothetical protein
MAIVTAVIAGSHRLKIIPIIWGLLAPLQGKRERVLVRLRGMALPSHQLRLRDGGVGALGRPAAGGV